MALLPLRYAPGLTLVRLSFRLDWHHAWVLLVLTQLWQQASVLVQLAAFVSGHPAGSDLAFSHDHGRPLAPSSVVPEHEVNSAGNLYS